MTVHVHTPQVSFAFYDFAPQLATINFCWSIQLVPNIQKHAKTYSHQNLFGHFPTLSHPFCSHSCIYQYVAPPYVLSLSQFCICKSYYYYYRFGRSRHILSKDMQDKKKGPLYLQKNFNILHCDKAGERPQTYEEFLTQVNLLCAM